jgi:hypothetical protein
MGVATWEVFVRTLRRMGLVVALSIALVGLPAMAAPTGPASAPLGVILQAERANVGVDVTSGGATVYDGDLLETQANGTLRAKLGGPQMVLRPDTSAQVHGLLNGFSGSLLHGTVIVSSTEGQTFQLLANGAMIRPVGTKATIAQVQWVNAKELMLTSNRGTLEVSMGDEVKTIEAGSSYRVEVEDSDPGTQGAGPQHAGRGRRLIFFLIAGGVAAGVGIGVWRALVSPDHP